MGNHLSADHRGRPRVSTSEETPKEDAVAIKKGQPSVWKLAGKRDQTVRHWQDAKITSFGEGAGDSH